MIADRQGWSRATLPLLGVVFVLLMPPQPAQAFDEYDPWIDVYKMPLFFLDRVSESADRRWSAERQIINGAFLVHDISITVRRHACGDTPCDLDNLRAVAAAPLEPDGATLQVRQLADRVIVEEDLMSACRNVTVGLRDGETYPVTIRATVCGAAVDAATAYLHNAAPATRASNKADIARNWRNGNDLSAYPTERRDTSAAWLDFGSIAGFEVQRVGSLIGVGDHVFTDRQVIVGRSPDNEFALLVFLNPCELRNGESDRGSACNRRHDALVDVFTIPGFTVLRVVDVAVAGGRQQQDVGRFADSTPVSLIVLRPGCRTYSVGKLESSLSQCTWGRMAAQFKSARGLGEFFGVDDARRRRFIGNDRDVRGFQVDHDRGNCRSIIAFMQPDGTVIGRACGSGKDALTEYLSRVSTSRRDLNLIDEAAQGEAQ